MSRTHSPRPAAHTFVAVLTIAFAATLAGPAFAEKYVASDAKLDVVSVDFVSESQTPAPDNATADVVKTKVNHTRGAVRFRVKLRDLSGPALTGVIADLRTNKRRYTLNFFRSGSRTTFDLTTRAGEPIKCRGMKRSSDLATDVVKFSVPRSCVGLPRWVRAGVVALVVQENAAFADDALRVGDLKPSGSLTFTERLKRA